MAAATTTTRALVLLCRSGNIEHARKLFDEMPHKNVVAFSSMIYRYATNGLFAESLNLFSRMQNTGIPPNSFALVALSVAASGARNFRLSESIRGTTVKRGFETDPFVATTMLVSYATCGDVDKIAIAKRLFDEMPHKNVVAFSSVIYGYATSSLFAESLNIFSHMQNSGIAPNSFTLVALLLASSGIRSSRLVGSIHGIAFKCGLESNPFVATAMLDSCARCGDVDSSRSLFRGLAERTLVSCNAMINGFVYNCCFEEALLLFKQLRAEFELVPNCVTMMSVTQSCVGYASFRLSESVYGCIIKAGFDADVLLMNSVFEMYLSFGCLETAKDFFGKMAVLDVVSWTSMMGIFLEFGRAAEALDMFLRMRSSGIEPDMVAMVNVIMSCALLGDLRRGRSVHSRICNSGMGLESSIGNSLITMYSKCGDPESGRLIFNHMMDKSLVSWTAMISGYLQNGQPRRGLELLIRMRREETYDVDLVTLVSLLASCGELASLEMCEQFHAYSINSGLIQFNPVKNSLVAGYGRCGHVHLAQAVFDEMNQRDLVSWNAMILSYGVNGEGEKALSLFRDVGRSGEEPDSTTYLNVLNACSHSGLVDDGLVIFERMVRRGVGVRGEHWGCVVDMLARSGRLVEARKLVKAMSEAHPNAWKALLGGCHTNCDLGVAEVAADELSQMSSKDLGHVVLLSNIYASVGRFENVEALRSRVGEKGLLKQIGFSLLDARPSDVG